MKPILNLTWQHHADWCILQDRIARVEASLAARRARRPSLSAAALRGVATKRRARA
jgi:hypothetical protein